jgi:GNAT superfamily N-acetyltransferase
MKWGSAYMEINYQIILAKPEHLAALPQIERAAAEVFPEGMIPDEVKDYVLSLDDFENALAKNQLWIAVTMDNNPVGFAVAIAKGKSAMLAELDVDPEHQRQGLGRKLVQTVINWAREEGFNNLNLTTFSNIPWNAPFYEKMGFRRLRGVELTADLITALDREAELGLKDRVAMQIELLTLEMSEQLIAPCGMNCGLCIAYQAQKYDLDKQGFRRKYCPGCLPRGKNCLHMKDACDKMGKGLIRFCYECIEFPCKRLKALDKRYRTKYHMSMIKNLITISEEGMKAFLESEEAKWRCSECGAAVCCHNGLCMHCNLDKLRLNRKYRWGEQ